MNTTTDEIAAENPAIEAEPKIELAADWNLFPGEREALSQLAGLTGDHERRP